MVAYIDEFKDRFRVGPICRVLAASLDCGFITPRGYRMFKSRPVRRMAARHEALARDILEIHADSFMAVYGYRKTHAQLLARGWDPAEIGRDQVMNVMRELGIRGVRRVVPEVLRKSGLARCRVGFSRLSAWCHRVGTCPGSGGPSSRR